MAILQFFLLIGLFLGVLQAQFDRIVRPRFTCWYPEWRLISPNQYERHVFVVYGYENPTSTTIFIPIGPENQISPSIYNTSQPNAFAAFQRRFAFSIDINFSLPLPIWTLQGQNLTLPLLDSTNLCASAFGNNCAGTGSKDDDPSLFADFCQSLNFCAPISHCNTSSQCNQEAFRCSANLTCNATTFSCTNTTLAPTALPTRAPTKQPTLSPTRAPTSVPTLVPTALPTRAPTRVPTSVPTLAPTTLPTRAPTLSPTQAPTSLPTPAPTGAPTALPTNAPTQAPTSLSTPLPTSLPTQAPTPVPTLAPTSMPSEENCSLCTFTQGGYGSICPQPGRNRCETLINDWENAQPGCLRDACFQSPIILGNETEGGKVVVFTSKRAIREYLPARGTPGVFLRSEENPVSTKAGVLGGQLLTAILNVQFSTHFATVAALRFSPNCSTVCASLRGLSLFEVIYIAQQVVANQPSVTYWRSFSPACLNQALALFNEAFNGCNTTMSSVEGPLACFHCSSSSLDNIEQEEEIINLSFNFGGLDNFSSLALLIVIAILALILFFIGIRGGGGGAIRQRYTRFT